MHVQASGSFCPSPCCCHRRQHSRRIFTLKTMEAAEATSRCPKAPLQGLTCFCVMGITVVEEAHM